MCTYVNTDMYTHTHTHTHTLSDVNFWHKLVIWTLERDAKSKLELQ